MDNDQLPHRIEPEIHDSEIPAVFDDLTVDELVVLHNVLAKSPEGRYLKERILTQRLRSMISEARKNYKQLKIK